MTSPPGQPASRALWRPGSSGFMAGDYLRTCGQDSRLVPLSIVSLAWPSSAPPSQVFCCFCLPPPPPVDPPLGRLPGVSSKVSQQVPTPENGEPAPSLFPCPANVRRAASAVQTVLYFCPGTSHQPPEGAHVNQHLLSISYSSTVWSLTTNCTGAEGRTD